MSDIGSNWDLEYHHHIIEDGRCQRCATSYYEALVKHCGPACPNCHSLRLQIHGQLSGCHCPDRVTCDCCGYLVCAECQGERVEATGEMLCAPCWCAKYDQEEVAS